MIVSTARQYVCNSTVTYLKVQRSWSTLPIVSRRLVNTVAVNAEGL